MGAQAIAGCNRDCYSPCCTTDGLLHDSTAVQVLTVCQRLQVSLPFPQLDVGDVPHTAEVGIMAVTHEKELVHLQQDSTLAAQLSTKQTLLVTASRQSTAEAQQHAAGIKTCALALLIPVCDARICLRAPTACPGLTPAPRTCTHVCHQQISWRIATSRCAS